MEKLLRRVSDAIGPAPVDMVDENTPNTEDGETFDFGIVTNQRKQDTLPSGRMKGPWVPPQPITFAPRNELKYFRPFLNPSHPANIYGPSQATDKPADANVPWVNPFTPFLYHGDKSNDTSSILLEGLGRVNPWDDPKLMREALNANPRNSMFLDLHGDGPPGNFEFALDKSAMAPGQRPLSFGWDVIQDAVGPKMTNMHNWYFTSCNEKGGCEPTKEFLNGVPTGVTNIVMTPKFYKGYPGWLESAGLGIPWPGLTNKLERIPPEARPIQYTLQPDGSWKAGEFKGFPPQKLSTGEWTTDREKIKQDANLWKNASPK